MSFYGIYETSGSALSAQTVRLNTISSNLANADSISGDPTQVYKPLKPIFASIYDTMSSRLPEGVVPVMIADVIEVDGISEGRYEPDNPLANDKGYVYYSGINVVNEMADLMSATRSFEANVKVISNVKAMQQSLLQLWNV